MRANRWSWVVLAAVATLATTPAVRAAPAQHTPTALERTVELMEALKGHRYAAACEVYDPLFWMMVGFRSRDCPRVLRETFPRGEPVAYRIHFGGNVGPSTAVVIASMALGDAARFCAPAWTAARHCARGSTYYLELTLKTLPVDWRGKGIRAPHDRWYVSSIGGV
jgi:hypothetical protein